MRFSNLFALSVVLTAALLSACGTERQGNTPRASQQGPQLLKRIATEPSVLSVTPDLIAPDCTQQFEGELIKRQFSRSYTCTSVERLTNTVGIHISAKEAGDFFDKRWSTADAANEVIAGNLALRPARQDSLKVVEVTDPGAKIGAPQERLFCASFTDHSGAIKATELWGTFRYENATVEYTAYTEREPECANAPKLQAMARALAAAQLTRIKSAPLVNQ